MKPLQDLYPDDSAHCYGCGRLNADGLHVKSEWHDGEAVAQLRHENVVQIYAVEVRATDGSLQLFPLALTLLGGRVVQTR